MKSVILISNTPIKLLDLADLYKDSGEVDLVSSRRIVVESAWGWFAFNTESSMEAEYEPDELLKIKTLMQSPSFIQLEYNTLDALSAAIMRLQSEPFLLLDDDHGLICTIREFKSRVDSRINKRP